jgi:hypothetical protein
MTYPTPHEDGGPDAMELVERYLQSVRFLLPRRQRDDVHRELSAEIQDAVEEQESLHGRALTADEMTAVLRRFGHPLTLALRYQPARALVGPETFPVFWFAVRLVLAILVVVHLVLPTLFFVATGDTGRILGLFLRFPSVATPVLFWMTVGAVVLDMKVVRAEIAKALLRWTPRDLPPVLKDETAAPPPVASVVLLPALGAWWLAGLYHPSLLLGPASSIVAFGPPFHALAPLMAFSVVAQFVSGLVRLARPHWRRFARASSVAIDALSLVTLFVLSRSSDLMVAVRPQDVEVVRAVNGAAGLGLAVAFTVVALQLAWKCVRYARTSTR